MMRLQHRLGGVIHPTVLPKQQPCLVDSRVFVGKDEGRTGSCSHPSDDSNARRQSSPYERNLPHPDGGRAVVYVTRRLHSKRLPRGDLSEIGMLCQLPSWQPQRIDGSPRTSGPPLTISVYRPILLLYRRAV